jgi:iron complex outermembrane receptor protein
MKIGVAFLVGGNSLLLCGSALAQGPSDASLATGTADITSAANSKSSSIVLAQAGPAPSDQGNQHSDSGGLQEIVVTAQRRSQNLADVPNSVSALTGQQLLNSGTHDLTGLQFLTPGFINSEGSGYTQMYIRGVGNSIFVGADPSVATYIDDVPRIYGTMVDQLMDVQRVEVLKGAQGGLYGRNATGGVVNIITRQPDTSAIDGTVLVSDGEHNTFRAQAYVNLPVNDIIAFSVAASRLSHGDYAKNITTNPDPYTASMFPTGSAVGTPQQTANYLNTGVQGRSGYDNQDLWAGDSKLLFKPTDNFKVTLAADYSLKQDTDGVQIVNQTPAVSQGLLSELLGAFGFPNNLPPNFVQGSGKFQVAEGTPSFVDLRDSGVSATPVWTLPGVELTSITASRHQTTDFLDDLQSMSIPLISAHVMTHKSFFYQELRAISTDSGPFHFLAGASYLRSTFAGDTTIGYFDIAAFNAAPTIVDYVVRNKSVYAQLGYDITSHIDLTVSGREIRESNNAVFTNPPPTDNISSLEKKFLPAATLSYKLDGGGNIYARYAEGFKAGGVNPIITPAAFPSTQGSVFGPETVDTYEIGYRAPLFDRTVQLTSALFYNKYDGLQTAAHSTPAYSAITLAIVNAGSARTYGVEESLNWQVSAPLTLGINAGYLNARYTNFAIENSSVLTSFNLSGTPMIDAPTAQLSLTAALDTPLNGRWNLFGNWMTSYISKVLFTQSGIPGVIPPAEQEAYWLTNVRFGVHSADDKYRIAVYADNLFNTGYFTYGSSSSEGTNTQWGDPRIVGVEAQYNF